MIHFFVFQSIWMAKREMIPLKQKQLPREIPPSIERREEGEALFVQ
jgi:hypothetical protein